MRYSIPYVVRSSGSPMDQGGPVLPMTKDDALFWRLFNQARDVEKRHGKQ